MKYRYLRTGPDGGWQMSADIYAKCPVCGYYMSLDPTKDDVCPCANMTKDTGMGRFGAKSSDDSIELYTKNTFVKSPVNMINNKRR